MKLNKFLAISFIIFLMLGTTAMTYSKNIKIAYADYTKIFYSFSDTKQYQDELNKLRNDLKDEINNLQNTIKTKQTYLLQNGSTLSKDEIISLLVELIKLKNDLELKVKELNDILKNKETEIRNSINTKIKQYIDEYRDKEKYDIIFDINSILANKKEYDITDDIIKYIKKRNAR